MVLGGRSSSFLSVCSKRSESGRLCSTTSTRLTMAKEQRTQAQEHDDTPIRRLRVVVLEGADAGQSYEPDTGQTISVGSSPDNDFVLNDPAVSRYHIELRQGAKGIEVLDLGSLNGTFLDGVRLLRAILPPGTRLRLGSTVIGVQDGAPARAQPTKAGPASPVWSGAAEPFESSTRPSTAWPAAPSRCSSKGKPVRARRSSRGQSTGPGHAISSRSSSSTAVLCPPR